MTLHRKLILTYVLIAVLPTILLCTYLINSIKELTVNRAINDAVRSVELVQSEFQRSLNVLVDISRQLYLSKNYSQLVEKEYSDTWDTVSAYFLFKDFENLNKVYSNQIETIRIYVDNDTILENWYLSKFTDNLLESGWYQAAMANPAKVIWYPTVNRNSFPPRNDCYSLVRLIESTSTQSVLVLDLNKAYINNLLNTGYGDIIVFDENGNILCSNKWNKAEWMSANYSFEAYSFSDKTRILDDIHEDGKYKTIIQDMRAEGVNGRFRIVSSFLLEDILSESNELFVRYLSITGMFIIFTSALAVYLSWTLKRRVAVLCHEMELVSMGDFSLVSTIKGSDEIGILSGSLNVMAENLKRLIEETYEADMQKRELLLKHNDIKLKLLTNQMNPHFLFNTLESLRMEARVRDEIEISEIISKLGRLLRKSIQTGSEELPLDDELQVVEDYLGIQAFRYGNRIQYDISVSEDSHDLSLLPFLIQPLVENSIVHGVENCETAVSLRINTFCEADDLIVEVIDTGIGMSHDKLKEIRDSLDMEEADCLHIGIRNVHLRIRLRYGAPYGLSIESKEHTKVTIRIPKVVKHHV